MIDHKFLKHWILPPNIYRMIGQIYFDYVSEDSGFGEVLGDNLRLKDKYQGKRCFIIANGSSLNMLDLEKIRGELSIVMNRFYLHPLCESWRPTFYCAVDRVNDYEGTDILHNVTTKIFPTEGYVFHISLKETLDNNGGYPTKKYYINTSVAVDTITDIHKSWLLTKNLPGCRSTSQMAIMVAMYCGCNPIYLLGMDSDWLSHRGIDRHFYESDIADHDLNTTPYSDLMLATLRQFRGYEVIRKYAEYRGIKIINATNGGFLDAFPRIAYEELFK